MVGRSDFEGTGGELVRIEAELLAKNDEGASRSDYVQRNLAPNQRRRQTPEHDGGICYGRLGTTLAVTDWARIGAGALRAGFQLTVRIGPHNRAAAGTDSDYIKHRRLHGVAFDHRGRCVAGLMIFDDRNVSRRAADVDREDVAIAGKLGGMN